MVNTTTIKSGCRAFENIFVAPFRQSNKMFCKNLNPEELTICPNFLKGKIGTPVGDVTALENVVKSAPKIKIEEQSSCAIGDSEMIINCSSNAEATETAKRIVLRQFDIPQGKKVFERSVNIRGSQVYVGQIGNEHMCTTHNKVHFDSPHNAPHEFDMYHNHPNHSSINGATPLSGADIINLIVDSNRSITALNSIGQYNTATITDITKLFSDINCQNQLEQMDVSVKVLTEIIKEATIISMGKEGERLLELRKLKQNNTLTKQLENEFKMLEEKFDNIGMFRYGDCESNLPLYTTSWHKALQKVLPKYGIEYKTNFSNLAGI